MQRRRFTVILLITAAIVRALASPADPQPLSKDRPLPATKASPLESGSSVDDALRAGQRMDDVIFSEDFETIAPGSLPPGWIRIDNDGGQSRILDRYSLWQTYDYGHDMAHSGQNVLMCHYNDAGRNDDWVIVPQQNLTETITLRYWVASQDPAYPESYEVRVSTTGSDPAQFVNLVHSDANVSSTWTERVLDLTAFGGAPLWIAFHHTSLERFVLKLDDIELEGTPMPTGSLGGTVYIDTRRNEPAAFATVMIPGVDVRTTASNSAGRWLMNNVPPGEYPLVVFHPNTAPLALPAVTVSEAETTTVNALLQVSEPDYHVWFRYGPRAIPDLDTTQMSLQVDTGVFIADMDVTLLLEHPYVGDLDIWLESPSGQVARLIRHDIGVSGDHITNAYLDDEAPWPYTAGSPPYTGNWRPIDPLSQFDGQKFQGRWWLYVADHYAGDVGQVLSYSLHVRATSASSVETGGRATPSVFSFGDSYPNPFNATTRFRFVIHRPAPVKLALFNVAGQRVATVIDKALPTGEHAVVFDAADLPSGLYLARLSALGISETRKVVLLK